MSWWLALVIAYLAISYTVGLGIIALYFAGICAIDYEGQLGLITLILYWLLSPIVVPWWFVTFIKANRGV